MSVSDMWDTNMEALGGVPCYLACTRSTKGHFEDCIRNLQTCISSTSKRYNEQVTTRHLVLL
jgi:hypothetical protein